MASAAAAIAALIISIVVLAQQMVITERADARSSRQSLNDFTSFEADKVDHFSDVDGFFHVRNWNASPLPAVKLIDGNVQLNEPTEERPYFTVKKMTIRVGKGAGDIPACTEVVYDLPQLLHNEAGFRRLSYLAFSGQRDRVLVRTADKTSALVADAGLQDGWSEAAKNLPGVRPVRQYPLADCARQSSDNPS